MNWRNIIEEVGAWIILAAMVAAAALVWADCWRPMPEKPGDSKPWSFIPAGRPAEKSNSVPSVP